MAASGNTASSFLTSVWDGAVAGGRTGAGRAWAELRNGVPGLPEPSREKAELRLHPVLPFAS